MLIMGVDPGTRVTGYGIIEVNGNSYRAVDYGCIRPPATLKLTDRYLIIHQGIGQLLDTHRPQALVVETQYVHNNVQSAMKLGMARGIIMLAASMRQIPIFEYAPSKAKSAVVGNGGASKKQMQGMTQRLLNLPSPPEPEDAADALALAICHAHSATYHGILAENAI